MPRSGREPWAAKPAVSTSNATKPLWAIATTSSVGSVTIAASAVVRRTSASVPRLPTSSSATAATITSPRKLFADRGGADEHRRRERSLHVAGPAAVKAAVPHRRRERALHPGDADGVHVRVQEQRAAAAGAARDPDDVGPSRGSLVELDLETGLAQPVGDERRDLALARPTRNRGPG